MSLKLLVKYTLILTIQIFTSGMPVTAQTFSKEQWEVLEQQDIRQAGKHEELTARLLSTDKELAMLTLNALANISDTLTAVPAGEILMNSADPELRECAAFVLGQISSRKSTEYLLAALETESDASVLVSVLNSLGKSGDGSALEKVVSYRSGDDRVNASIALSIARFGMRMVRSPAGFEKLNDLLQDSGPLTARNVAYALNRAGGRDFLIPVRSEVMKLTKSDDAEVRMWAFSALGKLQDTSLIEYSINSLENESDWRVRVNICNALGFQKAGTDLSLKLTKALVHRGSNDESIHVRVTAFTALGKFLEGPGTSSARELQKSVKKIIASAESADWHVVSEAVRTYAKVFRDKVKRELLSLFSQTRNYDLKAAVIGSFRFMDDAPVYRELRDSISSDVQRYNKVRPNTDGTMVGSRELAKVYKAFLETLSSLDDRLGDEDRNTVRLIYSEFASSREPDIVDICLRELQDSIYIKHRDETCRLMTFDYNELEVPREIDVILIFIEAWKEMKCITALDILTRNLASDHYDIAIASSRALKEITGIDREKEISASRFRTDHDREFIEGLMSRKFALVKTNRGDITIELFPRVAPYTVQNFVKLSEKGFYGGTVFHRVVPNFVIQGGDPGSTGYGGPGYSIRSEFSSLSFGTGYAGMASSGKDTEGSQFFITHSPQPHLDGRYTIFGKVVKGMDVVNIIQAGDIIESVTVSGN